MNTNSNKVNSRSGSCLTARNSQSGISHLLPILSRYPDIARPYFSDAADAWRDALSRAAGRKRGTR